MRNRNRRTVFLALLATATFVWAAIDSFDVPPEELAWLLLYCVIGVLLVAVLAALSVALIVGLGKLKRLLLGSAQDDSS